MKQLLALRKACAIQLTASLAVEGGYLYFWIAWQNETDFNSQCMLIAELTMQWRALRQPKGLLKMQPSPCLF